MENISLLIMAAGMGSRYGGLKQLDAMGPYGETIMDYSVYDAIQAGFTRVVFIIRKDFEQDFKEKVTQKYSREIQVDFAFQTLENLPKGITCPEERVKPWGTGHAILSASPMIQGSFVVINGDDYYGRESFQVVRDYYQKGGDQFSMVAFRLDKTLSAFGGVTRGLCTVENQLLETVVETENLEKTECGITSNRTITLDGSEPVSMNMWGFTPSLFEYLNSMFVEFLIKEGTKLKSEFLIPSVINDLIQSKKENVQVLRSNSSWFGVTYKEDKLFVISRIKQLIEDGVYPEKLFGR